MIEPVIRFLLTELEGIYVDCTLGLGGHSLKMFEAAGNGLRIIGIDRDEEALDEARKRLGKFGDRVKYICGNFGAIDRFLTGKKYNGFLLDLGLSSFQISDRKRGFSYMDDGPLDMCMGGEGRSVRELFATGDEREINRILRDYGEERKSRAIAHEIVSVRKRSELTRTSDLRSIVEKIVPQRKLFSSLSRVFQAFRIWTNDELENLKRFLPIATDLLLPGGRLVVMSYHSLEDRIVKDFFRGEEKGCVCPSDFPRCNCGREPTLKILTKRPLIPVQEEVEQNPRSRSAKLRVAERL